MEEWLPVTGWKEFYEVSNFGRVRSLERRVAHWRGGTRLVPSKIISGSIFDGYPFLHLRGGGRNIRTPLHTVVADAFIGPRPVGYEVCHNDGNRQNASASNLRYGTRKENHADMVAHGSRIVGERHHNTPLTEADVIDIRSARTKGVGLKETAARYGISKAAISAIGCRKTWKHVA